MIRAFYAASSGLVAQTVKQDVIAHNIANAQTPGFKGQKTIATSFEEELNAQLSGIRLACRPSYPDSPIAARKVLMDSAIDNTQGTIRETAFKTDLAIVGSGEFEVSRNGQTYTSRAGNLMLNNKGELCTADGANVMGENGPIQLPDDGWQVGDDGTITDKSGSTVAKIKIVGGQPNTTIKQGCLEEANVSIVSEMVEMIANMRSFEANQKVVQSVDGTLEKLINEVGKV